MSLSLLRCAALAALGTLPVIPQDQTPPGEPFRVSVDLVPVDAVVNDSKGRPVTDLTAADFEIIENGKPRAITQFARVGYGAAPLPRTFVFVADRCDSEPSQTLEYPLSFLEGFIANRLRPEDQAAVLRTVAGGNGAAQRFTGDPSLLAAQIRTAQPWPYSFGAVGNYHQRPPSTFLPKAAYEYHYGAASFNTAKAALGGLAVQPGRRILVIVSSLVGWTQLTKAEIQDLIDTANRSGVVIYAIDPGWYDPPYNENHGEKGQFAGNRRAIHDHLAEETGGLAFHEDFYDRYDELMDQGLLGSYVLAFLRASVLRVDEDQRGYYMMGYRPESGAPGAVNPGAVRVRARRRGLKVRFRSGYSQPPTEPVLPAATLRTALLSPYGPGEIGLRLTPAFSAEEVGEKPPRYKPFIRALLEVDTARLRLQSRPDGARRAAVRALAAAYDAHGREAASREALCAAEFAAGTGPPRALLCSVDLTLESGGGYMLRAAVMDEASAEIGAAYSAVAVPRFNAAVLKVSSLLVSAPPGAEQALSESNPAQRIFRPGDTVYYWFRLFGAGAQRGSGKTKLEINIFAIPSNAVSPPEEAPLYMEYKDTPPPAIVETEFEGSTAPVAGRFTLPKDMRPGRYFLDLRIRDVARNYAADFRPGEFDIFQRIATLATDINVVAPEGENAVGGR
jgi:VWFA-related protein